MKRKIITVSLALSLLVGSTFMTTSCIGSFKLTNKVLTWNRNIDNKFINELVFVSFWILPVYEVSALSDMLVVNSVEFWSGKSPIAKGKSVIEGENGRYLCECDEKGYTITGPDGVVTRLDFNADTREWSTMYNGERIVFLTFVDDTHVRVPVSNGHTMLVDISRNAQYAKADR